MLAMTSSHPVALLAVIVGQLLVHASALKVDARAVMQARAQASASTAATPAIVNQYSQVSATPAGKSGVSSSEAKASKKYLIASFPNMKQVAYCHLPDNVWRPLVIGDVTNPQGVAVDTPNMRLYVADPVLGKIFWYQLEIKEDGKLATGAQQFVAVEQYTANWLAVNGVGDLYFTGHAVVTPPQSAYDAVFRQDAQKIAFGNTLSPVEVYTRSNTGMPNSKVWMPSGIAVDSFNIYWGNQELGSSHGSICRGSRMNIGMVSSIQIKSMSTAHEEVRGLVGTGTTIYYLTPNGVFGVPKSQATTLTEQFDGFVAGPPSQDTNGAAFDPKSIAWDGDGTMYFTDYTSGVVYSLPAMDTNKHDLSKFVDAPGAYGVAVANFEQGGAIRRALSMPLVIGILFFKVAAYL